MSLKKFTNKQNEPVTLTDGRMVWLARSCAVVGHILLFSIRHQNWYVLLGKRGQGTPDCQGYWGLPCGYLDWDETLTQGMMREVWEECGLYLPNLKDNPDFGWSESACIHSGLDAKDHPWWISDNPGSGKQNISMHFAVAFSWRGEQFPQLSAENAEPDEVEDIAWVEIEEACSMDLAFNHAQHIRQLRQLKSELFESVQMQQETQP
ncbi:NUDIX hydrolase [Agarilytica rhodophyticola]|uniref:NUDIX hydrolase n=1 Tax=Agarilytica rhodophyticola TaxID=1737490 RepID=UPI0013159417|nr:NUDIX hydrolase [Agarilytica rhodophyticola]